jgi:hypothetical protein
LDEDYHVYLRKAYDLQFVDVLYMIQIRSGAKSIMYKNFDICEKNNIEIFYCNTDSILIKERNLDKMRRFISKEDGYFKIEGRDNKECVIVSQCKFCFRDDDKNQIRNLEE